MNAQVKHDEKANTLTVRIFDTSTVVGIYTIDQLLIGPVSCIFVKGLLVEYTVHNYDRNIHLNKIWSERLGKSFLAITQEADRALSAVLSY